MIYKGRKYRLSRRVVVLPREYEDVENHLAFGRTCPRDTLNAIRTNALWTPRSPYPTDVLEAINGDIGNLRYPVYARKVRSNGHYSQTFLMYGMDGTVYLCQDGKCYVRSYKIPDKWKENNGNTKAKTTEQNNSERTRQAE